MNNKVKLHVGQEVIIAQTFTQEHFNRFAELSGDDNPIHMDPEFSAKTSFGRTVAHGMLLYGNVSKILGKILPGPGTIQISHDMMFPNPTYVDEEVKIKIKVTTLYPNKNMARLETIITKPNGINGLQGSTLVFLPHSGKPFHPKWGSEEKEVKYAEKSERFFYKGFKIGQSDSIRRKFTPKELIKYQNLVGDTNPIFNDPIFVKKMGLDDVIIPGSLLGGLFSCQLGTRFPGRGTKWLKQRLIFLKPVYRNEEITSKVEIIRIRSEKHLLNLRTQCYRSSGDIVVEGEALVHVQDVEPK